MPPPYLIVSTSPPNHTKENQGNADTNRPAEFYWKNNLSPTSQPWLKQAVCECTPTDSEETTNVSVASSRFNFSRRHHNFSGHARWVSLQLNVSDALSIFVSIEFLLSYSCWRIFHSERKCWFKQMVADSFDFWHNASLTWIFESQIFYVIFNWNRENETKLIYRAFHCVSLGQAVFMNAI